MTAKYRKGFVQRDSVEREEYAKVPSASSGDGKARDSAGRPLLNSYSQSMNRCSRMQATAISEKKRTAGGAPSEEIRRTGLHLRGGSGLVQVFRYTEPRTADGTAAEINPRQTGDGAD